MRSRNAVTGVDYTVFPVSMVSLGLGHALFDSPWQLYLAQRWHAKTTDIPSTEGFSTQTLPRYARTDLSLSRAYTPQLDAMLQLRNLFNRDNRMPSAPASVGGIPDEHFSLNLRLRYRY